MAQTAVIEERHGRTVSMTQDGNTTTYQLHGRNGELLASTAKAPSGIWAHWLYAPRTNKPQAAGTSEYELCAQSWIRNRLHPGRAW